MCVRRVHAGLESRFVPEIERVSGDVCEKGRRILRSISLGALDAHAPLGAMVAKGQLAGPFYSAIWTTVGEVRVATVLAGINNLLGLKHFGIMKVASCRLPFFLDLY